jgi:hypothetical protein
MLGNSKPIAFDPYGGRRSRRRFPRWLLLLLGGIGLGAGGLFYAQERYLPPRLSAGETAQLRTAYNNADGARRRLESDGAETGKRLSAALADKTRLTSELAASRAEVDGLRGDIGALVAAFPPDPRGGAVEVRAAKFVANGAQLNYDVLLTRARGAGKPLTGVVKFTVEGDAAAGKASTFTAPVVNVSIGAQQMVRGDITLPDGLKAQQVTVQVLDRLGGRPLGMRVHRVRP